MALPTRRSYSGAADACTLTSAISAGDTSANLTGTVTNWPSTGTGPFYMVIDPGLAAEEKVLVSARSSGSITTMSRGQDGTTAAAHAVGASAYPVGAAVDFDEANSALSKMTTKGDLFVTTGSVYARLPVGTDTYALLADSGAANGVAWGQIAAGGIATGAVTSAKILDDTIVNADINSAAAIAYSKLNLATSIVNADVSTSAAIVDTKLATISTASKVSNSATTATSANTASAIVARDASGNFTAGTVTAALTGTASGNLVSGGALGTPSSGTLTNCTFPTVTNATNAANLTGLSKGSVTLTLNSSSQGTFNHGLGSTPSTVLLTNGDLAAAAGHFAVISTSSSQVNFEGVGTTPSTTVRVNFIAFA